MTSLTYVFALLYAGHLSTRISGLADHHTDQHRYRVTTSGSIEAFSRTIGTQAAKGYKLSSAAAYVNVSDGQPNFAAIFHRGLPTAYALVVGMEHSEVRRIIEEKADQYMMLRLVLGYRLSGRQWYAAYFEIDVMRKQIVMFKTRAQDGRQRAQNTGSRFSMLRTIDNEKDPLTIGTLMIPSSSGTHQISLMQMPLSTCERKGTAFKRLGFMPVAFQVYAIRNRPYCTGIWQKEPHGAFHISTGADLPTALRNVTDTRLQPRDVSTFRLHGRWHFAVLWTLGGSRPSSNLWYSTKPVPNVIRSQASLANTTLPAIEELMKALMIRHQLPTVSLAVAKRGQVRFRATFGLVPAPVSLIPNHVSMTPLLRLLPQNVFHEAYPIADISKPLTALAVFLLVHNGSLALDDRVFEGESALFAHGPLRNVTVQQLLWHTAADWPANTDSQGDIMLAYPDLPVSEFIRKVVHDHRPVRPAGSTFVYSDFNYLLLQRLIKRTTRMPYRDFIDRFVLQRAQVTRACLLGESCQNQRHTYRTFTDVAADRTRGTARLSAAKGWLMSPQDLLKFLGLVDGLTAPFADVLNATLLRTMLRPSPVTLNPRTGSGYASGWTIGGFGTARSVNGYHHSGLIEGGGGVLVQDHSNISFSILTNHDSRFGDLTGDMYNTMYSIIEHLSKQI